MKLNDYTMSVHPGAGLIGRFPSAVVLLSTADGATEPEQLIHLFGNGTPATELGAKLETVFAGLEPASVAAFAAVVETEEGLSVYLHGPVEVAADSPNVEFRAWGPTTTPLQRYEAPDAVGTLRVHLASNGNGGNGNGAALDLRAGVVSGDGLVLKRIGAPDSNGAPPRNGTVTVAEPVATAAPVAPVALPPLPIPLPAAVPAPTAAAPSRGLHPTYVTRLLTRLLLTLTLGVGATFALGPVLRVGFAPVSVTYTTVLISLALLLVIGLALWDPIYGVLQRTRKGNDWPAPFLLAQAVPEAALVYGVQNIFFGDLVVNQTALLVHLAVTAVLIAAAGYGLTFVPVARRLLFRAGQGKAPAAESTSDFRAATPTTATTTTESGSTAQVWGINCSEGHFNRPDARYCGTCGTAMHGLTREPVQGPRPALGYLVSDDGSAYVIDSDYVIGASPQSDTTVRDGRAKGLTINGTVSDVHADVRIDQWDVTISDRGHASGTYVREPDSASLIRLAPNQPFALQSGTHVHLGQRNFTFHALNRR